MTRNPLAKWLDEHGMKANKFAKLAGIPVPTAYRFVNDEVRTYPKITTLRRIESATGGDVTMRMMIEWNDRPPEESPLAKAQD